MEENSAINLLNSPCYDRTTFMNARQDQFFFILVVFNNAQRHTA